MNAILLGWALLGLPLLILGIYYLWRRWRTVFWMYIGALLLAFGYLTATGAMHDIGSIFVSDKEAAEPASDNAPAPADEPSLDAPAAESPAEPDAASASEPSSGSDAEPSTPEPVPAQ